MQNCEMRTLAENTRENDEIVDAVCIFFLSES